MLVMMLTTTTPLTSSGKIRSYNGNISLDWFLGALMSSLPLFTYSARSSSDERILNAPRIDTTYVPTQCATKRVFIYPFSVELHTCASGLYLKFIVGWTQKFVLLNSHGFSDAGKEMCKWEL
jgi:hypothetical protein